VDLTINERIRLIISNNIPKKSRFKFLSEISGIPETTWRTWDARNSAPSAQMIEAVAKRFPAYAFWLTTGIDDRFYGHGLPEPLEVAGEVFETSHKYFDLLLRIKESKTQKNKLELTLLENSLPIVKLAREKNIQASLLETNFSNSLNYINNLDNSLRIEKSLVHQPK
jgi:hypothetical protein